jgi:FAD/FMN-containing dehydrogenase
MTTNIDFKRRKVAARDLREAMQGTVALPGDSAYARSIAIWNGAVTRQPALIAMCESATDVQAALRVARANDFSGSIRGGGHDWAGRSLCDGGLVIDLSAMRGVTVDVNAKVATAAGGATGGRAVSPYGLAAVTGNVGAVGMAGFLLAGGYGPLTTRFGLGLDNLLGAEIVLADGRVLHRKIPTCFGPLEAAAATSAWLRQCAFASTQ